MGLVLLVACNTPPSPQPTATQVEMTVTATAVSQVTAVSQATAVIPPTNTPTPAQNTYLPFVNDTAPTLTPIPTITPIPTPAFPTYTGQPLAREEMGIQIHIHREDMSAIFSHLQTLGIGWVKVQVSWKLYQPAPDQYADDRFGELDQLVHQANANGIAVLLSVSKAPEWSRPTTELDGPPTDFSLYTDFMQYLAARYQDNVAAYELWNEPNLQREWNGMPLSAADLVALLRAGAQGVRAAAPTAVLISAAPATTGINDGIVAIDDRQYLRQMVEAGITDVVDALGVHPYGWGNAPDNSVSAPDTAVPSHNNHPSFFFQDTLRDYTALLAEFGVAEKQLWVTEFGWGSFASFGQGPPVGAEFMNNVTEWQQAPYTQRTFALAHEWPQVCPMILWNLN
ncbi:MAG: cellulase family glycosylhydrolase, partial [Anaerolineales bacterium]|nr:cellulase family glycosylhydrolase [Anaerolineales bacterium]